MQLASLEAFPRLHLLGAPTPIERLSRLEARLGHPGVGLFVKRDDLTPLGAGGNKLRKLEYLLGRAALDRVDTVLTVGGVQSNHARTTAAAAARAGLACELHLSRQVPRTDEDYEHNGNVLLDGLFGAATIVLPAESDPLVHAERRATELRALGKRVLVIPAGGSTPLGCLGYVRCALEVRAQEVELGLTFARIDVANGSAGTHAGLFAGLAAASANPARTRSWAVLANARVSRARTAELARGTLALLGDARVVRDDELDVDDSQRGSGYGVPTDAMVEAVRLVAETEGLLLDPVYSGKAFAGLLADVRAGVHTPGDALLFVMTGGTPALYAYRRVFS